jgi:integrase
VRAAFPVATWPALDRELWTAACATGNILDGRGPAAGWAPATRKYRARTYGRWLAFLQSCDALDPSVHPSARATPDLVQAFIDAMRCRRWKPVSVWSEVDQLDSVLAAMDPERDRSWLRRVVNRLHAAAPRSADVRTRLIPPQDLLARAIEAMRQAERSDDLRPDRRAVTFRNALMVALLAAIPLRRRSFVNLRIGHHLVLIADKAGWLRLDPADLKNGVAFDVPLPPTLVLFVRRYLDIHRPVLLGATQADYLWITTQGRPHSIHTISERIGTLTERWFGKRMTTHLFRHAAATAIAIETPEHVRLIAGLLGHSTLSTSERYYNKARALEAARGHHLALDRLRRRLQRTQRPEAQLRGL